MQITLTPAVDTRIRRTETFPNESDPKFNHIYRFPISREQLSNVELSIKVLDNEQISYNETVGEVAVTLEGQDFFTPVDVRTIIIIIALFYYKTH